MTRQGPNYHDDPRIEAMDQDAKVLPITEAGERVARRGSDLVRLALGQPEKYQVEEKVPFTSGEATRLERLIRNSDIGDPRITGRLELMIDAGEQRGAITANEANGLRHYLNNAEGFSDERSREPDFRERQAGN